MDLRQIECFLCLYHVASVTRAARQLGIVQSALSAQIARLEKHLQVRLFDRTHRGVTPTAAGNDLFRMLQPLATEVDSVRQRMLDLRGEATGLVRIGVVPSLGGGVAPAALRHYCRDHPNVGIRLTEAYSAELIDRVEAGGLDLAIVNRTRAIGNLLVQPLVSEELVLVGARSAAATGARRTPALDLAGGLPDALIVPSAGQGLRGLIDDALGRQGQALRPRLELDALSTTLGLVRQGDWQAILPVTAIFRELADGQLAIRRLVPTIRRDLVRVSHPRRPLSLAARHLADALFAQIEQAVELTNQALQAHAGPRGTPASRRRARGAVSGSDA